MGENGEWKGQECTALLPLCSGEFPLNYPAVCENLGLTFHAVGIFSLRRRISVSSTA